VKDFVILINFVCALSRVSMFVVGFIADNNHVDNQYGWREYDDSDTSEYMT
jgi:hypothetical protein